jgi:NAD(P)-dependent dehydrogenase (short-subunit alcohol dehydrogenase family)
MIHYLDVQDEDSVLQLFTAVKDRLGAPNILVNCAGRGADGRPLPIPAQSFHPGGLFLCVAARGKKATTKEIHQSNRFLPSSVAQSALGFAVSSMDGTDTMSASDFLQ